MTSAPVRAMRHCAMSAAPMQDMRPCMTRPTTYAASTTIVGVMMVGATMIATTPEKGAKEAAKLRERGLRLQNGGDRQSEKAEQQRSTRNARRSTAVRTYGLIAFSLALAHGNGPKAPSTLRPMISFAEENCQSSRPIRGLSISAARRSFSRPFPALPPRTAVHRFQCRRSVERIFGKPTAPNNSAIRKPMRVAR